MTQALPGALPPPPGLPLPGATPNPLDASDAWNYVVLGGKQSPGPPGYAVVAGASNPRKLNVLDGNGQTGATVVYAGDKLAQFTVWIYLVESSDWDQWFVWRDLLAKPPRGKRATSLTISHPALAPLGISAVLIEEEGQPEPDGETGLYKVPIKMVQWKKPTPALASPKGAFGDPSFTPPRTAAEREIDKLTNQVTDLLK